MSGSKRTTQAIGQTGEAIALAYLRRKGYKIVETRFRFLRGEIDIVARDREMLVFIEVKMRTGTSYGRPEEAVTARKQQQIRKVAEGYLLRHRLVDVACRFDVVAIRPDERGFCAVAHFENAF